MNTSRQDPLPKELPLLPLRSTALYPLGVAALQIGTPSTLEMLGANGVPNLPVALVIAPGAPEDPLDRKQLAKIGLLARVTDRLNLPGGTQQVTVQGLRRIRIDEVSEHDGYFLAQISAARERPASNARAQELIARVLTDLEALSQTIDRIPREVPRILRMNIADPSRFTDLVASLANFSVQQKDEVLQILSVEARLHYVLRELAFQLQRARQVEETAERGAAEEGESTVPTAAEHSAQLRRRIRLMQAELGEVDPVEREVVELLGHIEAEELPARVAARARIEAERLRMVPPAAPEAGDIRAYVDWLLNLPWHARATDGPRSIDLGTVSDMLDARLLGLEEQKTRLLDYLAVAKLRGDLHGPIPCLVGPPEVGKTALACALAAGLGRPLAKIELRGRDETDIAGVRRARAGAGPGRFIAALRDVGVRDPLFLLEEVDAVGPPKAEVEAAEALEEAIDTDRRETFIDRYLDLEFDLGEALFVATAQDFYRIPRDLRELMLEIRIAGYTPEEKVAISRQRLLPKLIAEHGLAPDDVAFSDDTLLFIARGYARDSGLGALKRALATLLRTRARAKAQGDEESWELEPPRIEEIIGLPRFSSTVAENRPEVGVVTGLAWTASGGDLMFIEALKMPGSGRLLITGLLGDVMRESVNAAYSYVRSRGEELGIDDAVFRDFDLHVHFPEGAIPKDGPSAGIAVTLAIASTLSNRPVRHDTAMSGEVTLRGKVIEVGGVKEKVLAAYRAGIREIVLPTRNERDLRDVPDDVKAKIEFHFVERMDEVLDIALLDGAKSADADAQAPTSGNEPSPKPARAARASGG